MTETVWTVLAALEWCAGYLAEKGDEHPRRSAEWLLSAATELSRVELYAFHDRPLTPEERATLRASVKRRATGEPLQYVTGEVAFRHLVVKVRPGVLIPRPETEVLVDEALRGLAPDALVCDLCTGSGCVGLSIAFERSDTTVWATDLSPLAVGLAAENAERLGLAERFAVLEGDLFAPLPPDVRGRLALVVANPPYVPSADVPDLPSEVAGYEPHLALDGGADGLDVARRIAEAARVYLSEEGRLALELDERMVSTFAEELHKWYEDVRVVQDLAGRDRIVIGQGPRTAATSG